MDASAKMQRFRPNVHDQKRRYSRLLALRRLGIADSGERVRDNSEPWARELTSLREAIAISDKIEALAEELEARK
jgi:hypothetical protein